MGTFSWYGKQKTDRVLVMGVLNVTPDSFSDGGAFFEHEAAVARGLEMVGEGADILDIGGESTRPGAEPVGADEELGRVLPVIERLSAQVDVPISIDTNKAEVARAALRAGATIVNDVTAFRGDPRMADLVAREGAGLVIMHMKGTPADMQRDPSYEDVVGEIRHFLAERVALALEAGIPRSHIMVDPGLGFGKTVEHNLEILRRLEAFRDLGVRLLVGPSRKSFIGRLAGLEVDRRVEATLAVCAVAVARGADAVRVHDVAPARRAVDMAAWLRASGGDHETTTE